MAIEITIKASDMTKVLANAGIGVTEAKAIVLDLLLFPERVLEEANSLQLAPGTAVKKPRGRPSRVKEESDPFEKDTVDNLNYVEDIDAPEDTVESSSTGVKKPKRVSFKTFGGPSMSPLS